LNRAKSSAFIGITCLTLVGLIAGCGTSTAGNSNNKSVSSSGSKLVVDEASDPSTLDPGLQYNTESYTVYRNIFDNLLHRDPKTLKIIPWIATSWTEKTPTEWTFTIKKGVKFQNGDALTAQDVAFSLQRILDASLHSPQLANFSEVTSRAASGDKVTIDTEKPAPTLLSQNAVEVTVSGCNTGLYQSNYSTPCLPCPAGN